jgi:hypothetical protein
MEAIKTEITISFRTETTLSICTHTALDVQESYLKRTLATFTSVFQVLLKKRRHVM